jgi:hypothetical protein
MDPVPIKYECSKSQFWLCIKGNCQLETLPPLNQCQFPDNTATIGSNKLLADIDGPL